MAKIKFKTIHLHMRNRDKLILVNDIIESYLQRGFRMTLRQLYYQLVSRDIIPNNDLEYGKLGDLMVAGRMMGVVDWDAIVDRGRAPKLPYFSDSVNDAIRAAGDEYREDRQFGQNTYVEIWVEKDALSEVLWYKSAHYHINLMVNRGYSSCTAMFQSFNRFKDAIDNGKQVHILYVGDHDPSGLDMLRDINERLAEFGCDEAQLTHIALTKRQINLYNPPPNPAKIKDPRYGWYVEKHGDVSWEVDALTPEALHQTVDVNIKNLIDMDKFKAAVLKEAENRAKLQSLPAMITNLRNWRDNTVNTLSVIDRIKRDLSADELNTYIELSRKLEEMKLKVPELMQF